MASEIVVKTPWENLERQRDFNLNAQIKRPSARDIPSSLSLPPSLSLFLGIHVVREARSNVRVLGNKLKKPADTPEAGSLITATGQLGLTNDTYVQQRSA